MHVLLRVLLGFQAVPIWVGRWVQGLLRVRDLGVSDNKGYLIWRSL